MPGYKGHVVGGCVAGGVLLVLLQQYCTSPALALQWLVCCLAGSLFPDIDVKSKGQHYFYWIIIAVLCVCIVRRNFYALSVCSVLALMPMLSRHRGLFHRGWFIIVLPLTIWMMGMHYHPAYATYFFKHTLFFITGALSHLWLDQGWHRMWRW